MKNIDHKITKRTVDFLNDLSPSAYNNCAPDVWAFAINKMNDLFSFGNPELLGPELKRQINKIK